MPKKNPTDPLTGGKPAPFKKKMAKALGTQVKGASPARKVMRATAKVPIKLGRSALTGGILDQDPPPVRRPTPIG